MAFPNGLSLLAAMSMLAASVVPGDRHGLPSGEYWRSHKIKIYTDKVETSPAFDTLCLATTAAGDMRFNLYIVANNLHTCEADGIARWTGELFEYRGSQASDDPYCVLQISRHGKQIVVEDTRVEVNGESHYCREIYCGVRGVIGELHFDISSRTRNARMTADCKYPD